MPYSIRKQKCKQSDGDSGSYTLSYTDKKGKGHSACHTSRKKARGQIAAIEGPYEGEELTGEDSLREAIRYLLREAGGDGGGDTPPEAVFGTTEDVKPIKSQLFTWTYIAELVDKKLDTHRDREERPPHLGDAEKAIKDIRTRGPKKDNEYGETAVIAAFNILNDDFDTAQSKSKGAEYDIDLRKEVAVAGKTLVPGTYEVKTLNEQNALARLGGAKAVDVASVPALESLTRLGRKYSSIIVKGNFTVTNDTAGQALKSLRDFFGGEFKNAKGKKRYQNMAGLQLSSTAISDIKNRAFLEQLEACVKALEDAGLSDVGGEKVTLTSSLSSDEDEDKYTFDPKTWDLQVQPYLNSKMGKEPDKKEVKALRDALRDMWGAIRDARASIEELSNPSFWDELAEKTQATGEDGLKGLLAVNKDGVQMYTFPELTVKSIVEQGRMELEPKAEKLSTTTAENLARINAGFTRSHPLSALIREMVRHAR